MNLPVPSVGIDPGPDWANNINASLSIIDGHNHTTGQGVQVPSSGININSDLPFNNSNATLLRTTRFSAQASPIAASSPDIACLFVSGVDLYYNDGAGNQIRVTQSGSVAGSTGTITGLPSGTASASYASVSGTFVFQQATSTAANLDVGSIAIRYPGSYPTPSGNYIQLQAPSSLASGYAITLPSLPAQQNFLTIDSSGNITAPIAYAGGINGSNLTTNINMPGKQVRENGNNVVVSNTNATNSLAIVRGTVNPTSSSPAAGEGFTVSNGGTGIVTVTFTSAFLSAPTITFGSYLAQQVVTNQGSGTSSFTAWIYVGGSFSNQFFDFIAIGPRA